MKIKKSVLFVILMLMTSFVIGDNYAFASGEITLTCVSRVAPFAIFEQSEGVSFKVSADRGKYTLTDYFGNVSPAEDFSNGKIVINNLPLGRYMISVSSGGETTDGAFSVVTDIDRRRDSSKCDFGLSAMSSHSYSSEDREKAYVRSIALAGVPYVREFCKAEEVNNTSSKLHWRYNKLLEEYHNQGMNVTFMIADLPGFADKYSRTGLEEGHKITRNMHSVYSLIKDICEQKGECLDAIEIENEIDYWAGTCDGPDLYAAFLKTASIAAADYSDNMLVSTAGFTDLPHNYVKKLLSNGVAPYFDIYNVHYYKKEDKTKQIVEYPSNVEEYYPMAKEYGLTGKMLWTGECGLRFPFEDNMNELTYSQQKQQARNTPTAFIEAQSGGVDKFFWFSHGYVNTYAYGVYNGFGTMDQKHQPNMSYSAISALTNVLGNSKYRGRIQTNSANIKAYCYSDAGTDIGCVWAENAENLTIPVKDGRVTLTDIMGNEHNIEAQNGQVTVTAGPDIQYIRAENGFDSNVVEDGLSYNKDYKRSSLTDAQKMVMLPLFSSDAESEARDKGYKLSSSQKNEVKLRVYNFNRKEMSGTITAESPDGWSVTGSGQSVNILPMQYADLSFSVRKNGSSGPTGCLPLVFAGEFGGEKTSPAVSYIRTEKDSDYTYSSALEVKSITYDGENLAAELNGAANGVKFSVNGRTYDAQVNGDTANLRVFLPEGVNEIYTSMFDTSGTASVSENNVTVSRNDGSYVVTYDANGGGGAPMSQLAAQGEKVRIPSDIPYKYDSIFIGWTTDKFSKTPEYNQGDEIGFDRNVVLYAVWADAINTDNTAKSAIFKAGHAIIKGKTDTANAGKATFVVFNQAASPQNLSAEDIVNVGETRIDLDGNYKLEFDVGDFDGYRYILNINGEIIDSYITETTLVYDWMERRIEYRIEDDKITVLARLDNYGDSEPPVTLITAFYDKDSRLLDTHVAVVNASKGFSGVGGQYKIPSGAVKHKIFLWSDVEKIIPLTEPYIQKY